MSLYSSQKVLGLLFLAAYDRRNLLEYSATSIAPRIPAINEAWNEDENQQDEQDEHDTRGKEGKEDDNDDQYILRYAQPYVEKTGGSESGH